MTGSKVLGIGLDPYTVDFSGEFFKGKDVSADKIMAGANADAERIRSMGLDFNWLLVDAKGRPEAAADAAKRALSARPADLVLIGGGVRLDPAQTLLLEALVNAVVEVAPNARFAFNTSPTTTAEAIERVAGAVMA